MPPLLIRWSTAPLALLKRSQSFPGRPIVEYMSIANIIFFFSSEPFNSPGNILRYGELQSRKQMVKSATHSRVVSFRESLLYIVHRGSCDNLETTVTDSFASIMRRWYRSALPSSSSSPSRAWSSPYSSHRRAGRSRWSRSVGSSRLARVAVGAVANRCSCCLRLW
jgi:hypothetical protein